MDIEIAHLTYRYKEEENLILDDINLQIAGRRMDLDQRMFGQWKDHPGIRDCRNSLPSANGAFMKGRCAH